MHNPSVGLYSLIARNGRVGLLGGSIIWLQTPVLCIAVQRFEHFFHQNTGYSWETRYTPSSRSSFNYREFTYVDLDYSIPTNNNILFPESPKHSSKFELPNFNMGEPVKRLMEDILFGGTAQVRAAAQEQPSLPGTWPNPFTAPRQHLSLRTAMAAFNMLQRISSYLEPKLNNPSAIRWKTIIEASSIYRSTIPFCGGQFSSDRPPVICNYYAVLVELEFLYSLFPREEIAAMMSDMACRLTAQQAVYGRALSTELLYQAYSSLRHGFRLVTDASSQEFQQLTNYLYGSCQGTHNMSFQLRGIYRVFTKTKAENPFDDWIQSSNNNKINSSKPSRLLLWHGTPLASLLGILEHGVQIHKRPEPQRPHYRQPTRPRLPRASAGINPGVIVTTRKAYRPRRTNHRYTRPAMFGAGIYLADASSKSAGYCQARTASNGEAVLLLCEADVGDEERRVRTYQSLPDGHDVVDEFGAQETRCIEGIGKTGPRRLEHGGWKRIGWDMDGGRGGGMQRGDGRDVWMVSLSCTCPFALLRGRLSANSPCTNGNVLTCCRIARHINTLRHRAQKRNVALQRVCPLQPRTCAHTVYRSAQHQRCHGTLVMGG